MDPPTLSGEPGKSDPYLILKLGKTVINERKTHVDDVTDYDVYKVRAGIVIIIIIIIITIIIIIIIIIITIIIIIIIITITIIIIIIIIIVVVVVARTASEAEVTSSSSPSSSLDHRMRHQVISDWPDLLNIAALSRSCLSSDVRVRRLDPGG
jgi:hypothetical protein